MGLQVGKYLFIDLSIADNWLWNVILYLLQRVYWCREVNYPGDQCVLSASYIDVYFRLLEVKQSMKLSAQLVESFLEIWVL